MAIDQDAAVQDVHYEQLRTQLVKDAMPHLRELYEMSGAETEGGYAALLPLLNEVRDTEAVS